MNGRMDMFATWRLCLSLMHLNIRHGKALAAFSPARSNYLAAIGSRHALAKTMFVSALSYGWLKCPFHDYLPF
jgi:hypothetical protein